MSADAKLEELGIQLPPPPPPGGVYKPIVIVGNMAYLSGHGPLLDDGETYMQGRVGDDVDLEGGQKAARQTGLALLATMRKGLGSLDRVKRVVKVLGLVNSTDDFARQPLVINGFSELMAEVDGGLVTSKMRALRMLGDPYSDQEIDSAAAAVAGRTELDALVAYLQNLGTVRSAR